MKRLSIISSVCISLCLSLVCSDVSPREEETTHINDSTVVITFAAVGDLMCHSTQFNYARQGSTYDFKPFFTDIKDYLSSADFTFGNFETVTAGSSHGYSGYPFFNSPDEYLDAIADAGFDLLTTSNNHSLDMKEKGLLRTIEQIDKRAMHYNGTFISQRDRDSLRIYEISGVKTAFLAYTYGTNGIPVPKGKNYIINLIDPGLIKSDIERAKQSSADIIIVHYHFGEEYKREPSAYQRDIVKMTFDAGADIVIGGHPHVLQPVEFFETRNSAVDTGFAAYSLGNFFSNQRWRYSDAGAVLYFQIAKDLRDNSVKVLTVEYLPTWVYRGGGEYRILPSGKSYDFLNHSDQFKINQAFEDTKLIFNNIILKNP